MINNLRQDWIINTVKNPKYTWKCKVLKNVTWMVEEGNEPNWFHRKMQELCFGFKWEKIDG
jgi:hypothetical protein